MTRQNDNHSPGPGPGRLVPSSHQRSELSNTMLGSVWKYIPIPNGLGGGGGGAILINISIRNGDLICYRMIIPAAQTRGIRSSPLPMQNPYSKTFLDVKFYMVMLKKGLLSVTL